MKGLAKLITKESFIDIKTDVAEAFLLTLETLSSYVINRKA